MIEYIAGLVKEQLTDILEEVIAKVLELLNADESVIEKWLDSLSPLRRKFAEKLLNFVEDILRVVAEEVVDSETSN